MKKILPIASDLLIIYLNLPQISDPVKGIPKNWNSVSAFKDIFKKVRSAWLSPVQWKAYLPVPAKVDRERMNGNLNPSSFCAK